MSFQNLGLSDSVVHGVQRMGYVDPSPIQLRAIPLILSGRDTYSVRADGNRKDSGVWTSLAVAFGFTPPTAPLSDP